MSKEINLLAVFPAFGSIIIIFILYIKTLKSYITRKQLAAMMFIGAGAYIFPMLLCTFLFDSAGLYPEELVIISFLIAGYVMNLIVFLVFNKWYINKI